MKELIRLGKITAPVGIKGELRVYPYIDMTRFSDIENVMIDGKSYTLVSARMQKDMNVIRLSRVNDRNTAELFRNREIIVKRSELKNMPESTYFIEDLVGMTVVSTDGRKVGTLKSVINNPAQDIYEIGSDDGNTVMIPAVKEFIVSVDVEENLMTVKLIEGMAGL